LPQDVEENSELMGMKKIAEGLLLYTKSFQFQSVIFQSGIDDRFDPQLSEGAESQLKHSPIDDS